MMGRPALPRKRDVKQTGTTGHGHHPFKAHRAGSVPMTPDATHRSAPGAFTGGPIIGALGGLIGLDGAE
jgi:hypothetical protein